MAGRGQSAVPARDDILPPVPVDIRRAKLAVVHVVSRGALVGLGAW